MREAVANSERIIFVTGRPAKGRGRNGSELGEGRLSVLVIDKPEWARTTG